MRPLVNKAGSAKRASSGCSLVCEQAKSRRRARTDMRCASRRPLFTIGLASEARSRVPAGLSQKGPLTGHNFYE